MLANLKYSLKDLLYNDKLFFTLQWNWGYILIFVLIWSYGFENVAFPLTSRQMLLLNAMLTGLIFLLMYVGEKYKYLYEEKIQVSYSDFYVFVFICAAFLIFSFNNLTNSLVGDQLYHAQASQTQTSIIADKIILLLKLGARKIEYRSILRATNIFLFAGVSLFIYLLGKLNLKFRFISLASLFLILRLLITNSYTEPHPPFRLFPLWFNSVFLGLNDFSFRSIALFSLIIFTLIIFKYCQNYFDRLTSLFFSLAVCSIPLFWHAASVVEQSIWTALAWSFVLLSIQKDFNNPKYVRWISVITIASLMRASAFVALIPIFIIIGFDFLKSFDVKKIGVYIIYALPVLVMLPFLLKSLIVGTPSTASEPGSISKILLSFKDWFSIRVLYYHVLLPWVLFLPFFWVSTLKNWQKTLVYISFFSVAYIVFYSIWTYLWGVPRYQAELWIPFLMLGFFKSFKFLYNKYPSLNRHLKLVLALLLCYNILIYTNLNWLNLPVDAWDNYFDQVKTGDIRVLSEGEGVFNTNDAVREAQRDGFSQSMCKAGITYGVFSEILNGYDIAEISMARNNYPLCSDWGPLNISEINKTQSIKLILFIDRYHKEGEIGEFLNSGQWVIWKRFYNNKYGSTIIGIQRKE